MLYLFIIVCIWLPLSLLNYWALLEKLKKASIRNPNAAIKIHPIRLVVDIASLGYFIYYFVK